MASVVHVMTTIWTTSLIPAINQLSNVAIGYIKRVYFVECILDRRVLQRPPYVLRLPSCPRSRLKARVRFNEACEKYSPSICAPELILFYGFALKERELMPLSLAPKRRTI